MTKHNYDIAVCYRVYPKVSKTPPVYADNKFKLAELCFHTFAEAANSLKIKLFVILDTCPKEYESIFTTRWNKDDLEIIRLNNAGNALTFKKQLEILTTQDYSDIVYFAEDDYFYLPSALLELYDFIKNMPNVDFAAAYDHPDLYNYELHNYKKETIKARSRNWQKIATTCLTFITKKAVLLEALPMFDTYSKNNYDASVWMSLTKMQVFNYPLAIKLILSNKEMLRIFTKLWYFGARENLFGRKYTLWTPYPSLATHLDSKKLAPNIDWNSVFSQKIKEIG